MMRRFDPARLLFVLIAVVALTATALPTAGQSRRGRDASPRAVATQPFTTTAPAP